MTQLDETEKAAALALTGRKAGGRFDLHKGRAAYATEWGAGKCHGTVNRRGSSRAKVILYRIQPYDPAYGGNIFEVNAADLRGISEASVLDNAIKALKPAPDGHLDLSIETMDRLVRSRNPVELAQFARTIHAIPTDERSKKIAEYLDVTLRKLASEIVTRVKSRRTSADIGKCFKSAVGLLEGILDGRAPAATFESFVSINPNHPRLARLPTTLSRVAAAPNGNGGAELRKAAHPGTTVGPEISEPEVTGGNGGDAKTEPSKPWYKHYPINFRARGAPQTPRR